MCIHFFRPLCVYSKSNRKQTSDLLIVYLLIGSTPGQMTPLSWQRVSCLAEIRTSFTLVVVSIAVLDSCLVCWEHGVRGCSVM